MKRETGIWFRPKLYLILKKNAQKITGVVMSYIEYIYG